MFCRLVVLEELDLNGSGCPVLSCDVIILHSPHSTRQGISGSSPHHHNDDDGGSSSRGSGCCDGGNSAQSNGHTNDSHASDSNNSNSIHESDKDVRRKVEDSENINILDLEYSMKNIPGKDKFNEKRVKEFVRNECILFLACFGDTAGDVSVWLLAGSVVPCCKSSQGW